MSDNTSSERSGDDHYIYHRTVEPTSEGANSDIVELVADIEQCEIEDLPPFWARIDDVVAGVFSGPPTPEAQVASSSPTRGTGYRSTRAATWS